MRENMPGQGYAQGAEDLVDKGLRRMNTFDATYLTPRLAKQLELVALKLGIRGADGTFSPYPAYIRNRGEWSEDAVGTGDDRNEAVLRAIRASRPASMKPGRPEDKEAPPMLPDGELAYLDALYEFCKDRIGLWPGTPAQKEWLNTVMYDFRATRDIAKDEGVSQPAVVLGRQRAVEKFTAYMDGKSALAEKLRQFLADKDAQDGGSRLHYLPRWVHG